MDRQQAYRQKYHQLNPDWQDSLSIYRNLIDGLVDKRTMILDVGCGHGDFLKPVYDRTAHTYGVDPDQRALDKNTFIKHKIKGTVEKLPFKESYFDLVCMAWVLEHLTDPQKAFEEVYRVLKPGGKVVFLTPSVWNYNVWLIRLIPEVFHNFFTEKLYGRQENDTYPKRYKLNSARKISHILVSIGFNKSLLIFNGDPSYISFGKLLFWLACLIEKVLDFKPLNFARVHLVGIHEKAK